MEKPLLSGIMDYINKVKLPLHMPGHKMGKGIRDKDFLRNILKLDVTELDITDNLYMPEGIIKEAQVLASKAFGSKKTFFIVNGATCAVQAMMLSVLNPGDSVLVARNSHVSVFSALVLGGFIPRYVSPRISDEFGLSLGIHPSDIQKALTEDIKAYVHTYPNYYGFCDDIKRISEIVKGQGIYLLVDEAHGSHFPFEERLPDSSLKHGADMVVHSLHKTLPALTQCAVLHINSDRIDEDRVFKALSLIQTSSPSYFFMSSMDAARAYMEEEGRKALTSLLCGLEDIIEDLDGLNGIRVLGKTLKERHEIFDYDITKVLVNLRDLGISGVQADRILFNDYGIKVELSDGENILAIFTVADNREDMEYFKDSIKDLARRYVNSGKKGVFNPPYIPEEIPEMVLTPREAFFSEKKWVDFDGSAGKICGEFIKPYPPGVPLLVPGERITKELIGYIKNLLRMGIRIIGTKDSTLSRIQVIK